MTGKTYEAIRNLPENPTKKIYWVVYNKDMVKYTEDLISLIRGEQYLKDHVTVVPIDKNRGSSNSHVYLDPMLHDHLGNGSH